MEFKEFSKIHRLEKTTILITQKLHGTNASLWIQSTDGLDVSPNHLAPFVTSDGKLLVRPAKRTSFIDRENDNFGFAKFTEENKDALAAALGVGTWFGEWVGPGINSGEGLTEKRLALFSVLALKDKMEQMKAGGLWPDKVDLVPVLFFGESANIGLEVEKAMARLKEEGSAYVPGFKRPEGVVAQVLGTSAVFKSVFEAEETQWRKKSEVRPSTVSNLPKVDHLLQPIRLEKLLSRDEIFIKGLPKTLPAISSAYVADLVAEGQLSADEEMQALEKKALGKVLFGFVKSELATKGLI